MPAQRLKRFLDEHHVKYVTIHHSPAFTAQEIAASAHIPGKELAKTVMIELDGDMAMAVLPASARVDLQAFRRAAGAETIKLAGEETFAREFPECEVGAMPPFGNLYGMRVFVEQTLTEDVEIAFNAGTHTELIRMSLDDFSRLVEPTVVSFAAVGAS